MTFTRAAIYAIIGTVVFILPALAPTYLETITRITTAILFIIGPLSNVVALIPFFARGDAAARAILELEQKLDSAHGAEQAAVEEFPAPQIRTPRTISLKDVQFAYRESGNETFKIGPLSLTVKSPEIVFLAGGNGSGKSTLLKLMAGLYPPESGCIEVDGVRVEASNLQSYRENFSAIFSDFHLFERLYGLLDISEDAVTELLTKMQLDKKIRYSKGRFSTLDVSTGQRKRLALVVSLLEARPVLVFDELAADQDPQFRMFLYTELLPELRNQGRTIIAATHDNRYFKYADRVVNMDYGKIESLVVSGGPEFDKFE
jgi:putative ATP-binding cassette transporter